MARLMEKKVDLELISMLMGINILENLKMEKSMEEEF